MKKALLGLLAAMALAIAAEPPIKDVSFVWLPNPPEDDVQQYHIYEVTNGTNYTRMVSVPGTQTRGTVANVLWDRSRTYVATAENWIGESPYSLPVVVAGRPSSPGSFQWDKP